MLVLLLPVAFSAAATGVAGGLLSRTDAMALVSITRGASSCISSKSLVICESRTEFNFSQRNRRSPSGYGVSPPVTTFKKGKHVLQLFFSPTQNLDALYQKKTQLFFKS